MAQVVVVNGAGGLLGQRVVRAVAAAPEVARVVALDRYPFPLPRRSESSAAVERLVGATALDEAGAALTEATTVVHLGPTTAGDPGPDGTGTVSSQPDDLRQLLDRLPGPVALVVLSSASVYGARADNPVPLTESAALRPLPDAPFAVGRAAVEDVARAWQAATPGSTVALLRPVVVASSELRRWFASSPWAAAGPEGDGAPPIQLLHLDDLVSAIEVARRRHLDGPFNVAPEGWIPPDARTALAGPAGRVRGATRAAARLLPGRSAASEAALSEAYGREPWVVASDRLRAEGWSPGSTSEEVFVEADAGGGWAAMSAKRRQQVSLGASSVVLAGAIAVTVWSLRRRRR